MSANQATLDFIDQYDEKNGKDWSNSKEGVAEFAEAFAREHQQLDEIALIIKKGTGNRRYWKNWELQVLSILEKTQKDH